MTSQLTVLLHHGGAVLTAGRLLHAARHIIATLILLAPKPGRTGRLLAAAGLGAPAQAPLNLLDHHLAVATGLVVNAGGMAGDFSGISWPILDLLAARGRGVLGAFHTEPGPARAPRPPRVQAGGHTACRDAAPDRQHHPAGAAAGAVRR
jgi:hypothetical protein